MSLSPGAKLGPYEVVELLGAGGMGEVYRARDRRLGRDVAVKVLPSEFARDAVRLRRFEQEARAVAALNHPHILTVYDIGAQDGTPYVVTELLEGETLREVLDRRSPTQRQVLAFAVQAAQGLAAAHQKGIVHRDLKPENLFLTTDGRVKILDFGLARVTSTVSAASTDTTQEDLTRPGMVLGTVAYMSPEQVKALPVDSRSDLFSLGVVLYELLSRKHPFRRETATATLAAILHDTPPAPSSMDAGIPPALDRVVKRCLEKNPEERILTAHELALALEAVLQAPAGAAWLTEVEERSPYPGLQSFTEKDAGVFFGREADVEALWQRLEHRGLLAVIGPSGAGKTSFVRAGIVPSKPEGWGAIVCKPGAAPMRSLGEALAPELATDPGALRQLLAFDEPGTAFDLLARWRRSKGGALLVVDQFEELFTLNSKETQERFAALLGRLAAEAGVHVLLSLRDDFLIRCSEYGALAPVFESLTPLPALAPEGLKRALAEPARKLGYGFEDDALVDEMVASVEGVRGALPLMAFAAAQLWEKRDRERKLLTREAYQEIGGVAGALAQHAEATMSRVGNERQAIVREIFRNLVTAQGTRVIVDRDELLSAFPERSDAEEVLRLLIDARLLTSYEVEEAEGQQSRHRVEVAHESLLRAWPRLVKWQAQDEEGAVLRDQLKQAARLWEDKSRTADLLWTGTAYQEFELWRERYAGKLTAVESDFARAMAEKARRRKRLVRLSVTAAFLALTGVAIAIGISRFQAKAEARRAEAGKLLALGRTQIDRSPTAALAYARKSLELADTPEARRFAVEVLWRGPVARILSPAKEAQGVDLEKEGERWISSPLFSPDARWLAARNGATGRIALFSSDGKPGRMLPPPPKTNAITLAFGPRSDLLVREGAGASLSVLSLPDLREVHRIDLGGVRSFGWVSGDRLMMVTRPKPKDPSAVLREWSLPDGEAKLVASGSHWFGSNTRLDPSGKWLADVRERALVLRPLDESRPSPERILGQLRDDLPGDSFLKFLPGGNGLVTVDKSGEIRLWPLNAGEPSPRRVIRGPEGTGAAWLIALDGSESHLARAGEAGIHLWDLHDPPDAEPAVLKAPLVGGMMEGEFDPSGRWLLDNDGTSFLFWPVSSPWMRVLPNRYGSTYQTDFTADGRWLASCSVDSPARVWPMNPADGTGRDMLPRQSCFGIAASPDSTDLLVGTWMDQQGGAHGRVFLYPIDGGPPRQLRTGWEGKAGTYALAFDPRGRRALACPTDFTRKGLKDPASRVLKSWDLVSGQERTYSLAELTDASWEGCESIGIAPDGGVFVQGKDSVLRLTLPDDPNGSVAAETVYSAPGPRFVLSRDGRQLLVWARPLPAVGAFEELVLIDLANRTSRPITTHGHRLFTAAFDPSGRLIVSGDVDGIVRVGPVTGEEPHLLLGHREMVSSVGVSSDGRWIASAAMTAIYLWPMPDVAKPPLHSLAHADLLAKLDDFTNLRLVPDPTASTGWKLEVGPFPGWKDVPTW